MIHGSFRPDHPLQSPSFAHIATRSRISEHQARFSCSAPTHSLWTWRSAARSRQRCGYRRTAATPTSRPSWWTSIPERGLPGRLRLERDGRHHPRPVSWVMGGAQAVRRGTGITAESRLRAHCASAGKGVRRLDDRDVQFFRGIACDRPTLVGSAFDPERPSRPPNDSAAVNAGEPAGRTRLCELRRQPPCP